MLMQLIDAMFLDAVKVSLINCSFCKIQFKKSQMRQMLSIMIKRDTHKTVCHQ